MHVDCAYPMMANILITTILFAIELFDATSKESSTVLTYLCIFIAQMSESCEHDL